MRDTEQTDAIIQLKELGLLKLAVVLKKEDFSEEIKNRFGAFFYSQVDEDEVADIETEELFGIGDSKDPVEHRLYRTVQLCDGETALTLLELCVLQAVEPESSQIMDLICDGNNDGVSIRRPPGPLTSWMT